MQAKIDQIPQLEAMRAGIGYRFTVKVRDFKLVLRPLSIVEIQQVYASVAAAMSELPPVQQTQFMQDSLMAQETLVLASTSDIDARDPHITNLILSRMTNDELAYLYKQYVAECDRISPLFEKMPAKEAQELVETLKKSPDQATRCSYSQLLSCLLSILSTEG